MNFGNIVENLQSRVTGVINSKVSGALSGISNQLGFNVLSLFGDTVKRTNDFLSSVYRDNSATGWVAASSLLSTKFLIQIVPPNTEFLDDKYKQTISDLVHELARFKSITIPDISIEINDYKRNNKPYFNAKEYSISEFTITLYERKDLIYTEAFQQWMLSAFPIVDGYRYMEYPDNYMDDIILYTDTLPDEEKNSLYSLRVYPTKVSGIQFDSTAVDTLSTIDITFKCAFPEKNNIFS